MRTALVVLSVAATLAASPLAAQGVGGVTSPRARGGAPPEASRERQQAIRERMRNATPEERKAVRERVRERRDALTPDQRAAMRSSGAGAARGTPPTPAQKEFAHALREKRQALRADVAAGKLDRRAAAEELRSWMKLNRPKPSSGDE